MKLGDIVKLSQYTEARNFAVKNGYTMQKVEGGYQIVEIPVKVLTVAEQNEVIRQTRERLYRETSDYLKADYDEAVARGSDNTDELKKAWLTSKDEIREKNPYIKESSDLTVD